MPVFTGSDTLTLLPAIILCLFACGTLIFDVIGRKVPRSRRWLMLFGIGGLAITGFSLWRQWSALAAGGLAQFTGAQGAVTLDGLGFFSNSLVLGATVLLFLTSYRFLEITREHSGEYYSLALFAQAGMYFMATASELITLFFRPRINVDLLLYSRRFHSRRPALERSRAEIPAAWRRFIGIHPLRIFFTLWNCGFDGTGGYLDGGEPARSGRSVCHRCGSHDCGGAALQNIRRAVSHVGA